MEILEPVRNGTPEVSALCSAGISNGLERIRPAVPARCDAVASRREPRRGRSDSTVKEREKEIASVPKAIVPRVFFSTSPHQGRAAKAWLVRELIVLENHRTQSRYHYCKNKVPADDHRWMSRGLLT